MTALYELAAQYRDIATRLQDMDLDEQTIADTLESVSGELEEKATNTAMVIRNLEASAAAIKEAEAGMAARRKTIERRAESLRRYLLDNMVACNMQKIESPYFQIAVRDNPPAVDVFEPGLLPAEYMRQPEPPPPAPDKAAIRVVLKSGHDVPGARLTHSKRIDIK